MDMAANPTIPTKPLDIVFLVDRSGSMASEAKMQSLNAAAEEALPFLRRSASELVGFAPQVRVLAFANSAEWINGEPIPIDTFWWPELRAEPRGLTETGVALSVLQSEALNAELAIPPALVLLTDGMPTDTSDPTFASALATLDAHPVGAIASRAAIALGADAHHETLEAFLKPVGGQPLTSDNPHQLSELIRVAASTAMRSATELVR